MVRNRDNVEHEEPYQMTGAALGVILRLAREDAGLSLRGLGELTGISHSFLQRLESGDYASTNAENLHRLARTLEIDERDLFALAGLAIPDGLPTFTPYLRAKYDLPDEALRELADHFAYISGKYDIRQLDDENGPEKASI